MRKPLLMTGAGREKQKGGMAETASPRNRIAMALFTLNFLITDDKGRTAADRHAHTFPEGAGKVMWKDVLDNKWYGPDPVIQRSRGAICVFPQDREVPHWVPSRLTRTVEVHHDNDPTALQDTDTADPVEDDATAVPDDDGADNPDSSGAEMENTVCLLNTGRGWHPRLTARYALDTPGKGFQTPQT